MAVLGRLWSRRDTAPGFVATSIVVLCLLFAYPVFSLFVLPGDVPQPWNFQDFGIYASAVDTWQAGGQLYQPVEGGGYWGTYLYPPVVLLLFQPIVALPMAHPGLAWGVLSVGLLWVALQALVHQLGVGLRWWERILGLWLLVGYHPLWLSVKLGQTAGFLAALLTVALVGLLADARRWSYASGALTAAVGGWKLAYAPVGAHLLADRRRLVGAIAGGGALLAVSLAVFGVSTHLRYLDVLAWGVGQGAGDRVPSPDAWLPPYFRQLHFLPWSQLLRLGIAAGVAVLAFCARDADRAVFGLGVASFLLITPLPYVYYFVALLPAVIGFVAVEFDRDGYPAIPVVALLLCQVHAVGLLGLSTVVSTAIADVPDGVYPLLQPGLWGVLGFFGLACYRVAQSVRLPHPDGPPSTGDGRSGDTAE